MGDCLGFCYARDFAQPGALFAHCDGFDVADTGFGKRGDKHSEVVRHSYEVVAMVEKLSYLDL